MTTALIIWAITSLLAMVPTVWAMWQAVRDWRTFDRHKRDAAALLELAKEELIRQVIIFGGQLLMFAVAVVSFLYDLEVWEHSVIVWMLIPLPALFGLLSYHSIHARERAERRLATKRLAEKRSKKSP